MYFAVAIMKYGGVQVTNFVLKDNLTNKSEPVDYSWSAALCILYSEFFFPQNLPTFLGCPCSAY